LQKRRHALLQNVVESSESDRSWLIRHVVALFLCHRVFEPFAIGVSHELSNTLRLVETDVLNRGNAHANSGLTIEPQIANTLMIHQALGRAVLQSHQDQAEADLKRHKAELLALMSVLAPSSEMKYLDGFSQKVIKKAVALKKAMIEEQALYHCFWVDSGTQYDKDRIEIEMHPAGGKATGASQVLCVFPGLERRMKKDYRQAPESIVVVKARAWTLESTSIPRTSQE